MSSINQHFTFNYSQPDEYRLSHDSVFLSRQVFEYLNGKDLSGTTALDICAGSGVVGMDFLFHRREARQNLPMHFEFLEIQDVYRSHFAENKIRLGTIATEIQFLLCNYNDLQNSEFKDRYSLILSAPPYFLKGRGKLSPSEFKNRCRFFIDSDLKNLMLGIANSLAPKGSAFILLRDLPEHKVDVIEEARTIVSGKLRLEVLGDIRGTHLVLLEKYSIF